MKATDLKEQSPIKTEARAVITVAPDTRLEDALALMTKHHIHHLPVMDNGALVGILIDHDVFSAFIADSSARNLIVARYMQRDVPTIDEAADVREALTRMLESHVSALPVMRDGNLAG